MATTLRTLAGRCKPSQWQVKVLLACGLVFILVLLYISTGQKAALGMVSGKPSKADTRTATNSKAIVTNQIGAGTDSRFGIHTKDTGSRNDRPTFSGLHKRRIEGEIQQATSGSKPDKVDIHGHRTEGQNYKSTSKPDGVNIHGHMTEGQTHKSTSKPDVVDIHGHRIEGQTNKSTSKPDAVDSHSQASAVEATTKSAQSQYGGYAKIDDLPAPKKLPVNCGLLFEGDPRELSRAVIKQYNEVAGGKKHSFEELKVGDCESFKSKRGYLTKPVSPEEEEFPLAFGITMYKDPEQAERLLRALYRPQNFYCIHIDTKSEKSVLDTMTGLAKCFPNVFLSSKRASVHWGYFSVLEPDLYCIDELVKHKKWRYFINLTGQEFPLKSNLDMVKIFKVFQGANDVPGSDFKKMAPGIKGRIQWVHKEGKGKTKYEKRPFPHNITMAKGSIHMLASREFAEYIATDPVALEFREWSKDTAHPDEHFFNSLEYSPQLGVPGAYTGEPEEWMGVTRWKEWEWYGYKCQGKFVRSVCVVGVGDLPVLLKSKALIVNKLHLDYNPLAFDCLEELTFNRTRDEILGHRNFDVQPYTQLKFVQDRLKVLHGGVTERGIKIR